MQTQQAILLGDESGVDTSMQAVRMSWKSLVGSAVAACGLASVGYSAGQSSLRGLRVNGGTLEVLRTTDDFEQSFNVWADGLTCVKLNDYVSKIVAGSAIATSLDAAEFMDWYKGSVTAADKIIANGVMTAAIEKACLPAAPAPKAAVVAAPAADFSYMAFGHLYSAETAGRPWAEISKIDSVVRGAQVPLAHSAGVQKLHLWYHDHLSNTDRKDFDDKAVAHMRQGE